MTPIISSNSMTKTFSRRSFLAGSVLAGVNVVLMARQPPTSAGAPDPKLIDDLVAAYRILAQQGVLDGFGHVSARHNRAANRFIMSRSLAPELVTANDLIEFDLDANAVDAKGRSLYSERFIHAEIYRARPDVRAVVHNHAPSLIPFGVTTVPLRPMYHMASFIGNGVPVFDIRKSFGMTDMLVSDSKKGHALAEALGDKKYSPYAWSRRCRCRLDNPDCRRPEHLPRYQRKNSGAVIGFGRQHHIS